MPAATIAVSNTEAFVRLLIILVISSLIGLEREINNKPAGLRTNVMVGLGATLMTLASLRAVELVHGGIAVDPTRIAAQIVTGIGFIGAGAILRPASADGHVVGLTTSATLWVVCGMGISVGMGFYFEAIVASLMVLFTFIVLTRVMNRLRDRVIRLRALTGKTDPHHHHGEETREK